MPLVTSCYPPPIWHISPHHQGYLLLFELFDSDLQGIGGSFDIDQHWRIHATSYISPVLQRPSIARHLPDLQRPGPQNSRSLVLRHVRRGTPLVLRNLFLFRWNGCVLLATPTRAGVLPDFYDSIRSFSVGVRTVFVDAVARVFGVIGIESVLNGFLVVELRFFGLVGFVAENGGR